MAESPVFIAIRPATLGKNTSIPPQVIDKRSSPDLLNVRFTYGQLQSRAGFKGKYFGCGTHPLSIMTIYTSDGLSQIVGALCLDRLYKQITSTSVMTPVQSAVEISMSADTNTSVSIDNISGIPSGYALSDVIVGSIIKDAAGDIPASTTVVGVNTTTGVITLSQAATGSTSTTITVAAHKGFTTGDSNNFSVDIGEGTYTSRIMNGGLIFPSTGYGAIMAFTNAVDGVFIVFVGDSAPHSGKVICERLYDAGSAGILGANCVAFFDNKLIIGGTSNSSSEILWSASSAFSDFTSAGSGSILLGEGIDWIQSMRKMGEFLVVYKEQSIYIGQTSGKVDPAIVFSPMSGQGIGLSAPETISDLGGGHIFLGRDNVYTLSTDGIQAVGEQIKGELFGLYGDNGIIPAYINRCIGKVVREFSEYWLMIPTGKIPEVTNLLSRPSMDFIIDEGVTVTNGDATITVVSAAIAKYIKIGDTIYSTHFGSATVIGLPHTSSTVADGSIEIDKAATSTVVGAEIITGNDDSCIGNGDGAFTTTTIVDSGNLGGIYQSVQFTSGTYAELDIPLINLGTTGQREVSLLVWINGSVSGTLLCAEFNVSNASLGQIHQRAFTSASTSFSPVAFSFTCVSANCRKITIAIRNNTINEAMGIDGVQLCDITNVPVELRYNLDGYYIPGYKGPYGETSPIPFFTGSIGPWILDTVWVYNYQLGSWACWRIPITGFGYDSVLDSFTIADLTGTVDEQLWRFDDKLLETLSPTNLLGSMDGQIYEMSAAYQRDYDGFYNFPILMYWQSKDFDLDKPETDKTFSRLIISHEVSHPATVITVSVSTNSGVSWTDQTVTIRQGYTETYADFFITGAQVRFKVQTNGVLKISGFTAKVIPRGEANAY